jgi:hypothetical protein
MRSKQISHNPEDAPWITRLMTDPHAAVPVGVAALTQRTTIALAQPGGWERFGANSAFAKQPSCLKVPTRQANPAFVLETENSAVGRSFIARECQISRSTHTMRWSDGCSAPAGQ